MTDLKFKEYDRHNFRAYFTQDRKLLCVQQAIPIELVNCYRNGNPAHQVENPDEYILFGFDSARWSWSDLLTCFSDCKTADDIARRMISVFGG